MALAKARRQNPREMAAGGGRAGSTSPPWPTRPRSPAPASSTSGSATTGSSQSPGRPARRRVAGHLPARDAQDGRHRLLVAQRRQADARRPHPLDGHRRQPGAHLRRARPPGDPRQPPRRLGLAVRHDPLGLEEPPRRGGLRRRPGRRARPALPAGPVADQGRRVAGGAVRQGLRAREPGEGRRGRRGLRQAGGGDGADARRGRPRDRRGARRRRRRPGRDRQAPRGDPENRALWERFMPHCLAALQAIYDRLGVRFDVQLGESFYDPMLAGVVETSRRRGSPRRARGRRSSSSRGRTPRSSSARATAPTTTRPPTWRRSSTASRPGTPT